MLNHLVVPKCMRRLPDLQTKLPQMSITPLVPCSIRRDCGNSGIRFEAIRKAREWVKTLQVPVRHLKGAREPLAPRYPIDDILALVNPYIRKPFDMHEVVLRLVDDSRLIMFKGSYGKILLTCWAEIHGMSSAFHCSCIQY